MSDLEERVSQFNSLTLPGQPMAMHMGTSYLVNDLWKEVQRLRALIDSMESRVDAILNDDVCIVCGENKPYENGVCWNCLNW